MSANIVLNTLSNISNYLTSGGDNFGVWLNRSVSVIFQKGIKPALDYFLWTRTSSMFNYGAAMTFTGVAVVQLTSGDGFNKLKAIPLLLLACAFAYQGSSIAG